MRVKRRKTKQTSSAINIGDTLLQNRKLFLYGPVTHESVEQIIKNLMALDTLPMKKREDELIWLYINSGGGDVLAAFSLIDTFQMLRHKVVTFVVGEACSAAGLISICGDSRVMTEHSWWMSHDMRGGIWGDYSAKVEYRATFIKKLWNQIANILEETTKLTKKEINRARTGELWFQPQECLEKGIVDMLIVPKQEETKNKSKKSLTKKT